MMLNQLINNIIETNLKRMDEWVRVLKELSRS